ncbi:N,N-dimethylformamidase beta subunit family domain-containing protein [Sphingobium sp. KCTC 72723]|uniref:N,N-dimethylformamidase beta subunit family domain-containing protein n=1 Tax=Sphingobium sp. KCTC 72723 TaxID=2733867 RepID=UPI00165D3759|nr:N,N-dimethylformamidase beta subunit family domain-containing protein [Sphingobium sp. KCTC 72723]
MTQLTGYSDPLSITAGDAVDFMITGDLGKADIRIVRLLHGDTNPDGPGFVEEEIDCDLPADCAIGPQVTQHGSFARVTTGAGQLADLPAGTLYAFIQPTSPGVGEQVIAGCWGVDGPTGYQLLIDATGRLAFRIGTGNGVKEVVLETRLAPKCWYFVAAGWDASLGIISLRQIGKVSRWNSRVGIVADYDYDDSTLIHHSTGFAATEGVDFLIAGRPSSNGLVEALFNGKIDRPGIRSQVLTDDELLALSCGESVSTGILAHWDTSLGYTATGIGDRISDVGPHGLHADGINRPIRGMTGWNWNGIEDCFRLDPSQYGGVAFHDDALIDCAWTPNARFETSRTLKSGCYALRVRCNGKEDHIPFFVRTAEPKAKIAVLIATFSYLAYANERLAHDGAAMQAVAGRTAVLQSSQLDDALSESFGLSTYDLHSDGAGVCFSSWRRPIRNMRPRYRISAMGLPWAFPADLSLIWWLHAAGYDYDIITDHDLHRDGQAALAPYNAIVNCTHPEYHSRPMLDAIEDYLGDGGRLLYLGGNGYYWVTSPREDAPWCVEVRKLDSGIRGWQADPGEGYLTSTGERSGIWRQRGRPPQKLVGVGFTTEGMDESKPFERMQDSFDPRVAWMFENIGEDELIGDFGLALDGASGLEMDRYDLALGTPPHTLLLAASFGHSDSYPLVPEEILVTYVGRGGTQDPMVRGDITYFTTANGGAVFSAGSIAWSQALPCNGGDNNVARLTRNVLDRLASDEPLAEL